MKVIKLFETATGAILNENKTKIFGLGSWNNKVEWPIPWIQNSITTFKSLGILFSNDFNTAVNMNWEDVLSAIETKIQTMQTTCSTIYQRAILLNCIIFSKLWYVSHILPLPMSYANKIKRVAFNYIWGRKHYEPIRRSTLCLPKNEGGLGVIDISYKSQSILTTSFLKLYNSDYKITFMSDYYNYIRIGRILNINNEPNAVSYTGTPYYTQIIEIVRKCFHVRGFPVLNAKQMYVKILPENKPLVEFNYQTYQWKNIWKNVCSILILPKEREILFKFLHEVLLRGKKVIFVYYVIFCNFNKCNKDVLLSFVRGILKCE